MKKTGVISLTISILFIAAVAGYFFVKKNYLSNLTADNVGNDTLTVTPPVLEYGIPIDSFNIEAGVIKSGQLPANLFRALGATDPIINQLIVLHVDTFDLRKIKAGNTYKAFYSIDTLNTLQYFVYELSATEYAVFDLRDSLKIHLDTKPVTLVRKCGEATITSSLWNAVADSDMSQMVAVELSDIYAWSIDFFGVQKGDAFKVIYDELYVDSVSVGIGLIHAACFTHMGKPYYAFHFHQDSINGYWDEQGNNLKKAFLKAPLKFSRVSSGFTYARKHPILKTVRAHTGVDYAAPAGTPVMSIGQGTVVEKGYKGQGGNTIKIRHNSTYTSAYLHLSKYGKGVNAGSRVEQGQIIGYVGSTGLSTGAHLDFRVWKNGTPINPLKMESPPADPIKAEYQTKFDSIKVALQAELNIISTTPTDSIK